MALRNGVMVLGPTRFAVAVRLRDGSIRTTVRRRPTDGEHLGRRIPMLRGPVGLLNMLRVLPGVRRAEPSARLGPESVGTAATLLIGSMVSAQARRRARTPLVGELAASGISLALTLATMRAGSVAAYHGAEHKAIGGYELGIDAARAPREHPRCGTQLAIPMLVLSSLATHLALAAAPRQPRTARMVGQLVGITAATELFRAGQRGRGTIVARAAAKLGLAMQRHVTTSEPTRAQLDVAEASRDAVLAAEARVTMV